MSNFNFSVEGITVVLLLVSFLAVLTLIFKILFRAKYYVGALFIFAFCVEKGRVIIVRLVLINEPPSIIEHGQNRWLANLLDNSASFILINGFLFLTLLILTADLANRAIKMEAAKTFIGSKYKPIHINNIEQVTIQHVTVNELNVEEKSENE